MEQYTKETSEHVPKKSRKRNKNRKVRSNDEVLEKASEIAELKDDSVVVSKHIQVTTTNKSKSKSQDISNTTHDSIEDNATTDSGLVLKKSKTKKQFNEDESEVKDEDIDKFCDELDEKDNEQYENWVKLFEANFMSKKKKT